MSLYEVKYSTYNYGIETNKWNIIIVYTILLNVNFVFKYYYYHFSKHFPSNNVYL